MYPCMTSEQSAIHTTPDPRLTQEGGNVYPVPFIPYGIYRTNLGTLPPYHSSALILRRNSQEHLLMRAYIPKVFRDTLCDKGDIPNGRALFYGANDSEEEDYMFTAKPAFKSAPPIPLLRIASRRILVYLSRRHT